MDTLYTFPMIRWRLKDTMNSHGITRYALQKESGVAMNTIRDMYDGKTKRPDLTVLDRLIQSLKRLTGKPMSMMDVLEYEEGK